MKEVIQLLTEAPDYELDPQAIELIKKWDATPTALQILEVLDKCVYCAWASGFTMQVLNLLYDTTLKNEGKKHEDMVPLATWRTELD